MNYKQIQVPNVTLSHFRANKTPWITFPPEESCTEEDQMSCSMNEPESNHICSSHSVQLLTEGRDYCFVEGIGEEDKSP